METPLLASDEEPPAASFSSGPGTSEEESSFSRLIARVNPLQALSMLYDESLSHHQHVHANDAAFPRNYHALLSNDGNTNAEENSFDPLRRSSRTIIAASTLCLTHLCLVWGSYMSNVWAETHVQIELPFFGGGRGFQQSISDVTLRSLGLAALLQDLSMVDQYGVLGLLWSLTLILPCIFMIMGPLFVVHDFTYGSFIEARRQKHCRSSRNVLESCLRLSLLLIYVLLLIGVASSGITLDSSASSSYAGIAGTQLHVGDRILGPMACYAIGTSCGLAMIVLLRWPSCSTRQRSNTVHAAPSAADTIPSLRPVAAPHNDVMRSPPPEAFAHPWRLSNQQDDSSPAMTVLEEGLPAGATTTPLSSSRNSPSRRGTTTTTSTHASPLQRPSVAKSTESSTRINTTNTADTIGSPKPTFTQKVLVFETGLLSTLLWVPSVYLPCFCVSYGGIIVDFMTDDAVHRSVSLATLPTVVWQQGRQPPGTATWILLVLSVILNVTVVLAPLLASCLCLIVWLGDNAVWKRKARSLLFALSPLLSGVVFCVALLATVHALVPLGRYLLLSSDAPLGTICHAMTKVTGESCLEVHARLDWGAWSFLVQSLALEAFVFTTLRWG